MPPASCEPDPRIERSRRLVLAAALELLGEVGYGGLTIEGVAARAGVGKSTIYRHWDGRLELVEDAVRLLKPDAAPPAGGPVRERVVALLQQVAVSLADSMWSRCLPAIIDAAERDPGVLDIHRRLTCERREVMVGLLAEGVATGEIAAGTDLSLLAEALVGPIIVRRLLFHEPFAPDEVPRLVDQLLPPG
ncbi:MAG TPA: TetR/AcrR family transcriptional regulator [Acidimicrobiales bacterium]|nr:TetR/AcrR family transcriptional regulator [Acidimicrobiales bacterium]